jgi:signal transduction histidine kinase
VLAAVLRELTTNVARHAGARHCRLVVREDAAATTLTVGDDGRGGASLDGYGLRGVAERVRAAGGTLTPRAGDGTTVAVVLPRAGAGARVPDRRGRATTHAAAPVAAASPEAA